MTKQLVIIPTYNEKENINAIIKAVADLQTRFDILVVDDNSPDGTAQIVKGLQSDINGLNLLERPGKQGLGTAYISGFNWALENGYDYIFEMDADFSHNPKDLERLLAACLEDGADMSVGSRYVKGGNVVNWPVKRVFLSYYASWYVRLITGMPVKDTTAGFVCYHRDVLNKLNLELIKFKGYAFQIEMKFLTWKHGFKIKEVPITFADRKYGESKMSKSIVKEAVFGVIGMKFMSFFKKFNKVSR